MERDGVERGVGEVAGRGRGFDTQGFGAGAFASLILYN